MAKKELKKSVKSAKKEYYRNYRKQHPEKSKQAQQRFWEKKAKEMQNQERSDK